MKVLLVASSGGHLQHLRWLESWWTQHERRWVTFPTPDALAALAGEDVVWAHHPTNRSLPNLLRNLLLAWRTTGAWHADLVVTTGAGVAVPFAWAAWLRGVPVVFIEVYDRGTTPTLTGRLLAPVVSAVVLQHEAQRVAYPSGVLLGPLR